MQEIKKFVNFKEMTLANSMNVPGMRKRDALNLADTKIKKEFAEITSREEWVRKIKEKITTRNVEKFDPLETGMTEFIP